MSNRKKIRHRGTYAATLRLTMGAARTARSEARHPQRVAKRNAEREAKANRNRMDRAA